MLKRHTCLILFLMVFLYGCKASKENGNDVDDLSVDKDYDLIDSENDLELDSGGDDPDSIDEDDADKNIDNDFDEEPVDEDVADDSDIAESLCASNPCNFKNKTVCIEIEIWGTGKKRYYCSCDEGWFGSKCDVCQKGYFGQSCKQCNCKKNEICDDGLDGDGACSCATEIVDGKCSCYSGWSGENCEIFGENWSCSREGEICNENIDCCFDTACILSKCVKNTRYDSESALLADSQQGSLIAAVRSGFIYLYDISTLEWIFVFGEGETANIDFSPDGSTLAAVNDSCLFLYDLDTGEKEVVDCGLSYCYELKYSPDGKMIAATHWGGFNVYKLIDGKFEFYFSDSFENISFGINTYSVRFSADSSFLSVGAGATSDYHNIHIYDVNEKKIVHELPLYEYYAQSAFSEDGKYIAVGGYSLNGAIDGWYEDPAYIYNCSDWSLKEHIGYIRESLSFLSFNYSGDYLLIDNAVYRVGGYFFPFISDHPSNIFSQNGRNLISISKGALHKYSIPGFEFLEAGKNNGGLRHFFPKNGKNVVSFTSSFDVVFYEPLSEKEIRRFKMQNLDQLYLNFKLSDSNAYSLSYSDDYYRRKGFFITNLETGEIIYKLDEIIARAAAFSPDDRIFAVHDGVTFKTEVRRIDSGELVFSLQHSEEDQVIDIDFSPDGLFLMIRFQEKTTMFDVKTGVEVYSLNVSGNHAFFPDASRFLIIDMNSRVFTTVTGAEVATDYSGITSENAVVTSDLKHIVFNRGFFNMETSTFYPFNIKYYINDISVSPDNTLLFLSDRNFARVVDISNSIEKFEVKCQADSDCSPGFFCNVASGRCFAEINYK